MKHKYGIDVSAGAREIFEVPDIERSFYSKKDAIIHLAAAIIAPEDEIVDVNLELAKRVVLAIRQHNPTTQLVLASSIHNHANSPYGIMKGRVSDYLSEQCAKLGIKFTDITLPNLFGEFSRPYHNNFTGTFCYRIANDKIPEIIKDREVELLHYGYVADQISEIVIDGKEGAYQLYGDMTTVSGVAQLLANQMANYRELNVPIFGSRLEALMFNTLHSFLYEKKPVKRLELKGDMASTFEAFSDKFPIGKRSSIELAPGQSTEPVFHFEKLVRILVLGGEAELHIRKITDRKFSKIKLNTAALLDIPTMHEYTISNNGNTEFCGMRWETNSESGLNGDNWQSDNGEKVVG